MSETTTRHLNMSAKLSISVMCLVLSGCGSVPYQTSDLVPPAKRCLVVPGALPKLKDGDDLVQSYASAVRSYGRETSKLKCIQRWTHTVLNK